MQYFVPVWTMMQTYFRIDQVPAILARAVIAQGRRPQQPTPVKTMLNVLCTIDNTRTVPRNSSGCCSTTIAAAVSVRKMILPCLHRNAIPVWSTSKLRYRSRLLQVFLAGRYQFHKLRLVVIYFEVGTKRSSSSHAITTDVPGSVHVSVSPARD